jgi:hypothetical protein
LRGIEVERSTDFSRTGTLKMRVGALAGCLLLLLATPALSAPRAWKAGDKPPAVAGVSLGDSEQHALDVLGVPDEVVPNADGEVLQYPAKGLEITATKKDGVVAIHLLKPEAGAIDGIKIGDVARAVILKWGVPTGGQGRTAEFGTPAWAIAVHLADKEPTIVDLTLAYRRANPTVDSSKLNVFQTQ